MSTENSQQKSREEASLIGRFLTLDALILLMGCLSLIYGIMERKMENIFWAAIIIPGFFILQRVRKKDWKKHWEDLAEEKIRREEMSRRKTMDDK